MNRRSSNNKTVKSLKEKEYILEDYARASKTALSLQTQKGGRLLIILIFLAIAAAIYWASWAKVDEIARGLGQVIPSSRLQVVQNLEGGIVENILVKEGDLVGPGQVLLQLDDTNFSSSFNENIAEYFSTIATVSRLRAETKKVDLTFPDILANYPEVKENEIALYKSRKDRIKTEVAILEEKAYQHSQTLKALKNRHAHLKKSYQLGLKELNMTRPMARKGIVSEVEVLQLEQQVNELLTNMRQAEDDIPRLVAAVKEAENRIHDTVLKFQQKALVDLKEYELKLAQLEEIKNSLEDRVVRRAVRSPVSGIVKTLYVNTVGGIIQPGMSLLEIVPINDNLLIEAEISPKDVAFLRLGLPAVIKFSAYDYSIYGGLDGVLSHISADTVKNGRGDPVYLVKIETNKNHLGKGSQSLDIIPGMRASVDIVTGKKTVLDYLLKPLLKAKNNALTER